MQSPFRRTALELCLENGWAQMPVIRDCMAPLIPGGSSVTIVPRKPRELARGDIVLLERKGHFFLHRFLGWMHKDGEPFLLCKGDARRRPDIPWPAEAVLGIATRVKTGEQEKNLRDEKDRAFGRLKATLCYFPARILVELIHRRWKPTLKTSGEMNPHI